MNEIRREFMQKKQNDKKKKQKKKKTKQKKNKLTDMPNCTSNIKHAHSETNKADRHKSRAPSKQRPPDRQTNRRSGL